MTNLDEKIEVLAQADGIIQYLIDVEEDYLKGFELTKEETVAKLNTGDISQEEHNEILAEIEEAEKYLLKRIEALKKDTIKPFIINALRQGLDSGCEKYGVKMKDVVEFGFKLAALQDATFYAHECVMEVLDSLEDKGKPLN